MMRRERKLVQMRDKVEKRKRAPARVLELLVPTSRPVAGAAEQDRSYLTPVD